MKRTPLRSMSAKRRRLLPVRARVVAEVHARDGSCQAARKVPHIDCGGPLDVHELAPRSVDPGGWLDPDKAILICRRHHSWVDDHPLEAHALGLHKFSYEVLE